MGVCDFSLSGYKSFIGGTGGCLYDMLLVFFFVLGCYRVVNSQCVGCVLGLREGTYGREHLKARGLCPRGFFSAPELFSLVVSLCCHSHDWANWIH